MILTCVLNLIAVCTFAVVVADRHIFDEVRIQCSASILISLRLRLYY
jgi:hypothetical protein